MYAPRVSVSLLALLFAAGAAATDYDEAALDRLFTSKSTRLAIDRMRTANSTAPVDKGGRSTPARITVNGLVQRSDGKRTVWVNGEADQGRRNVSGVTLPSKQKDKGSVAVYVDGRLVRIKPGDTWSKTSDD